MQPHNIVLKFNYNGIDHTVTSGEHELCKITLHAIDHYGGTRLLLSIDAYKELLLGDCTMQFSIQYHQSLGIYCNGYQSWTESKVFKNDAIIAPIRKGFRFLANNFGDYGFFPYKKSKGIIHGWTYSHIKLPQKKLLFVGSLNEKNGFTNISHDTNINECVVTKQLEGKRIEGAHVLMDIFIKTDAEYVVYSDYFMLLKPQLPQDAPPPAIGWTSWYHYYTKITEKIIIQNVENFYNEKIPLDYFQIDDGYQEAVGDWLMVNNKFPNGMRYLTDSIHQKGYKAGLWLAPFSVEQKSTIFKHHKDWLQYDESGNPVKMGFNPLWSGWFYALDFYKDEVKKYLREVFHTVLQEWDFDMVKLDFLYGVAQHPRLGKSRGEVMYDGMILLRELCGNKKILGCGVPLASAFGIADYCRIGQDVHLSWEHGFLKWIRGRERVSTFLALQNTIHRRHLDGHVFVNDPDVFILRSKKQSLSKEERFTLLHVNILFGNLLFTSDNIGEYDTDTLQLYKSIFPLMEKVNIDLTQHEDLYAVQYQIKDRHYISLINIGEKRMFMKLPRGVYFDKNTKDIIHGDSQIDIKAHQSILLYSIGYSPFALIGTDGGHFFPAAEVQEIWMEGDDLRYRLSDNILNQPTVYFRIPKEYEIKSVNGKDFVRIEKKDFSLIIAS